MPFNDTNIPSAEPELVEIDDTNKEIPARAVFSDSSTLEFPPGYTFTPDNHHEEGSDKVIQVRLRCAPPIDPKTAKPRFDSTLIGKGYKKSIVQRIVDRYTELEAKREAALKATQN